VLTGTVEVTSSKAELICPLGQGGALLSVSNAPVRIGGADVAPGKGVKISPTDGGSPVRVPGPVHGITGFEQIAEGPDTVDLYAVADNATAEVSFLTP
jgi:hypothetical protein